MWESRLIWPSGRPAWWDNAWRHGIGTLEHGHRRVEERPDLYVCLPGRPDIGIKIRGGGHGDVEVKTLHEQSDGWQLWEKTVILRWNDLEAARFATLLRVNASFDDASADARPIDGVRRVLKAAGVASHEVTVGKERMQASAGDLLAAIPGQSAHPVDLAELVEIQLPGRPDPLFSVCVESMDPGPSVAMCVPQAGAICCSYPELLVRFIEQTL